MNKHDNERIRKCISEMHKRQYHNPFKPKKESMKVRILTALALFVFYATVFSMVVGFVKYIAISSTNDHVITLKEIQTNEIQCIANNGTFEVNIKTISDKESNKTIYKDYNCWFQDEQKDDSSLFDDDTPVTSGGMPSMSGLPGGPF